MSGTVTACAKHRITPAWGYSECPGCEVESLRAEIEQLKEENAELQRLHGYWKQRAKSAEGHLFSSDFQAACRQLHSMTSFHETPIEQLDVSQQAKIHRAVCGVLATVNHQRAARRPKDLDQPITEEQP